MTLSNASASSVTDTAPTNYTHRQGDVTSHIGIHQQIDALVSRINLGSMLFGIVGNFLCICVFKNKALLKKRFNWYLLILAFIDCIFCTIVFLNYLVFNINQERALYDLSKFTCYFTDFIVNSVDEYSVFLTLLLSIDRLNAITNPIRNKFFVTNRYQKQLTFVGMALITLVNMPYFFLSQRMYVIPEHVETSSKETLEYDTDDSLVGHHKQPYCEYETFMENNMNLSDERHKMKYIYIIYCNIFIPLLFNLIPALAILILNLALWFFMKNYTQSSSASKKEKKKSFFSITFFNSSHKLRMTKSQQSHYFTIIAIGLWLLLTSIPYYMLTTYNWATSLNIINDNTRLHMTVQAISSAFFNSNHCINILIYGMFHKDFRFDFLRTFFNIFNLNPLVKLNPVILQSKRITKRNPQVDKIVSMYSSKEASQLMSNMNSNNVNKSYQFVDANIKLGSVIQSDEDMKSFSDMPNEMTPNQRLFLPKPNSFLFKYFKHSAKSEARKKEASNEALEENLRLG